MCIILAESQKIMKSYRHIYYYTLFHFFNLLSFDPYLQKYITHFFNHYLADITAIVVGVSGFQ